MLTKEDILFNLEELDLQYEEAGYTLWPEEDIDPVFLKVQINGMDVYVHDKTYVALMDWFEELIGELEDCPEV